MHFDKNTNTITENAIQTGRYLIKIEVSDQHTVALRNLKFTVYDNKTTNILCLGNSITNGTNKLNSYRRSLWQLLHTANYNFDFIGSWSNHHMGGDVPDPGFDMDHDGHSG